MIYRARINGNASYTTVEEIVNINEITLINKTILNAYYYMMENNMSSIIYAFLGVAVQLEEVEIIS